MADQPADGQPSHLQKLMADGGALHPSIPKKVREAGYLTAPNVERYRVITHFFYERYKLQQHRLKTRQIWQHVREVYEPEYTLDECAADLDRLVEWGNLAREQDRDAVGSIEEWRNRDHVYDITPLTIRLEEALELDRNDGGTRGSLDPTLIEEILANLDGLHRTLEKTDSKRERDREHVAKRIRRPWQNIVRQFDELTSSANAFHHALRDAQPSDPTEIKAFRVYKDILLDNLSGFINELVDAGEHLRALTRLWVSEGIDLRLTNVLTEHDVRHVADPKRGKLDAGEVREHYTREVAALVGWFQHDGGMDALKRTTRNAIEAVIRATARITDRMRAGTSRRADLTRLAHAFGRCERVEDAHVLGALTLGSPAARHIQGAEQWGVMSDSRSVWEQPAHEVPMRRIARGQRPKPRPEPVRDRSAEQQELLRREDERRRREQAAWDALFADGPIDLGTLVVDDVEVRDRILEALDSCLVSEELRGSASDGSALRLIPPEPGEPPGVLRAPDGDLLTPRFRLVREAPDEEAA